MGALECLADRGGLILTAPESGGLGHLPGVYYSSWQCLTPSSRRAPVVERDDLDELVLIASDASDDTLQRGGPGPTPRQTEASPQVCCAV